MAVTVAAFRARFPEFSDDVTYLIQELRSS